MAYIPLPIIPVSLDQLQLDLENYRIPTRSADEAAALKYLFASEDVIDAARLILREGYFDNEVPIVIQSGEHFTVLEGNRRVSALKALHNPRLVPAHEKEISALLKRYAVEALDLPTTIRVIVAPDRSTAAPHIARLHTTLPKKRWSRDQQANFYFSLIEPGITVEDIKAEYSGVDVPRFIKMAVMRRFLAGVRFSDSSLHDYVVSDSLKMSALEYAYRPKEIAGRFGVSFDKNGFLLPIDSHPQDVGAVLSGGELAVLELLIARFRSGTLNTRSPELRRNSREFNDLLTELDSVAIAAEQSGYGTSKGDETGADRSESSEDAAKEKHESEPGNGSRENDSGNKEESGKRGPNRPETKKNIDMSGVDYARVPAGLKVRFIEFRSISTFDFPIATAMLMRLVLESTVKYHFERLKTPVSGELTGIMKIVRDNYGKKKYLKDSIGTLCSGSGQQPGSCQWFNLASHSGEVPITREDVHKAWQQILPLVRFLLDQAP